MNGPGPETVVIDSLTLYQYHGICHWNLSHRRIVSISPDVTVNLGAVIACASGDQLQGWVEVASLTDVDCHWYGAEGEVMKDGWIR
jgi:hypothetical protein